MHEGPLFCHVAKTGIVPGFIHGLSQPSLGAVLELPNAPAAGEGLCRLVASLSDEFGDCPEPLQPYRDGQAAEPQELARGISATVSWLQSVVGVPVVATPHVAEDRETKGAWSVFLPSFHPPSARSALTWAVEEVNRGDGARDGFAERLSAAFDHIGEGVPPGVNNRQFISAALRLGIPVLTRAGGMLQYGHGRSGRIFSSSLTERTSALGVRTSRSKTTANRFLQEAGIPVPRQLEVDSEDNAVDAAETIGFPVVVKPSDLDGGVGVSAGLMTAETVRTAFRRARSAGERVVVEAFIPGKDYRINVFHGRVAMAVERVPASVVGDGQSSISQLIDRVNEDPRRRTEKWFQMMPLRIDDEASELLAEQGLTPDAIPDEGQFISLRRAANVSTGGSVTRVLDKVHPENAAIAIRAAKALRLDLAGVDLITGDISRPWYEDGGAICEVNAQVQFGLSDPSQFEALLRTIVPGNGRVPIALLLLPPDQVEHAEAEILNSLSRDFCVGTATEGSAFVGRSPLMMADRGIRTSVRAVLSSTDVDAMVVILNRPGPLFSGTPVDRIDVLGIGAPLKSPDDPLGSAVRLVAEQGVREILVAGGEDAPAPGRISNVPVRRVTGPELLKRTLAALRDLRR